MNKKITHPGNIIIAGFGVMLLLMSYLIYRTITADVQIIAADFYGEEQKLQSRLDAINNTKAYTDAIQVKKEGTTVQVSIPQELNDHMENGLMEFYCVSNAQYDQKIPLTRNESGTYNFDYKDWHKTKYLAKISFINDGKNYYKEYYINL